MSLVLRVIRFSPRQFLTLTGWAIFIYCVIPVPLGLVTRAVFDEIVHRPARPGLWIAIAVLAGLQVAEVLGEFGLSFPWSAIQQRTHSLFQHNLMAGILRGYGRHGLTQSPGAALARFRDEPGAITSGSLDAVCDLIGRAVFALIAAVVMWRISPLATIAAFAPVVVTAAMTDALGNRAARYGAAARQSTSRLSGFVGELMASHLALIAGGARDRALTRMAEIGEERRRLGVRDTVYSQALSSLNFHVVNIGTAIVLLAVASAIRSGRFSVGDLALFVVFLDQLTYLPAEIGRLITEAKQTDKATERMHALVPGEAALAVANPVSLGPVVARTIQSPPRAPLRRLDIDGLTYRHPSSGRGIEDVSFSLEHGTFTVVTGQIGSGKTTLLHTILGLLPSQSGQVQWNGERVDDPSTFMVPPRAAFTPQVPRLFSESLRDNLELGRIVDQEAVQTAIRSAVLEADLTVLGDGLDTLVGPRGVKLSGGQVQRSAAARMFLADADLLVIDDLSSALDAETEAELWRRLFSRLPRVTCLAVSHRPVALHRADRILLIEDGRLRGAGVLRADVGARPRNT